jgi:hypothetical protein
MNTKNSNPGLDPRVLAYLAFVKKLQESTNEIPKQITLSLDEFEKIQSLLESEIIEKKLQEELITKYDLCEDDDELNEKSEKAFNKECNILSPSEDKYMDKFFVDHGILSKSRKMLKVFQQIEKFRKRVQILITGEPGTGKEGISKAIHKLSGIPGELKSVNAAEMAGDLFKDKLFGHVKGAFNDAHEDRPGEIELAHNGTLFLDEIGDIEHKNQEELLRVFQEKIVQRTGSVKSIKVNFRLLCATNKDISELVKCGKMRKDFAGRIASSLKIELPPLTDRLSDIPHLSHYFFKRELTSLRNEAIDDFPELDEYNAREADPSQDKVTVELPFDITPEDFNVVINLKDWSETNIRGLENYIRLVAASVDSSFDDINQLNRASFLKLIEDPDADISEIRNFSKYKSNPDYELVELLFQNNFKDSTASEQSPYGRGAFISNITTLILQIGKDVKFETNTISEILLSFQDSFIEVDNKKLHEYVDQKLAQLVNAKSDRVKKLYKKKIVGDALNDLKEKREDLISN